MLDQTFELPSKLTFVRPFDMASDPTFGSWRFDRRD